MYQQHRRFLIWWVYREPQQLREQHERIHFILHHNSGTSSKHGSFEVVQAAYGFEHDCRDSKLLLAGNHHHGALNCQAGRELHSKCRSLTWGRLHFKGSTQARDAITYDVQTYTATTLFTQNLRG